MHRTLSRLLLPLALLLGGASHAWAALDIGDPTRNFSTRAALGGKVFNFSLSDALAKGPVVLYFFPAADSTDCSIEAHAFAEAIDQFTALGATVVGVSGDDIEVLTRFSVKACQNKFAVASDESKAIIRSFDALMQTRPDFANRISYVIGQDGKIAYYYQNLDPHKHVGRMLGALRALPRKVAAP